MASAAFIEWWDYEINSGFVAWTPDPGSVVITPQNPSTLAAGAWKDLTWGTLTANPLNASAPPGTTGSSFSVQDPVLGPFPPSSDLQTNGAWVPGASVTHNNWEITQSVNIDATLRSRITLTALATQTGPDLGLPPISDQTDYLIRFEETPNLVGNPGGCLVPPGAGEQPCPDVFVLLNPADLVRDIITPDYIYTATLQITGLTTLSNAVCAELGQGAGCKGFTTNEFKTNAIGTQFRITARPVQIPEPATLAVIGLGLLAMGAVRRRKTS
jgi:hypothetical protein